jgi:hypothetical protein
MRYAALSSLAQILLFGIFVESLAPEEITSSREHSILSKKGSSLSSSADLLQIHANPLHGISSSDAATSNTAPPVASVQFAARQTMFDYAAVQGLLVLSQRLKGLSIPDVERTFHVPVLGDFRWEKIGVGSTSHGHDEIPYVLEPC